MKPRLRPIPLPPELLRGGVRWVCINDEAVGFGLTWRQAYWRWWNARCNLRAILREKGILQ